jgi:hypothetical protein
MSLESHESMIVLAPPAYTRPAPPPDTPVEVAPPPAKTPEEIRAVEAVFAQQEKESQTVAGLLNMYVGGMVLHDILVDSLSQPDDEDEDEPKAKDEPED